jgi:NADH-quinone oxidoreductase subunit L
MGALKGPMRATFLTYAAGMLALCGFPLFSGFWSKDGILGAAHGWGPSHWPYFMLMFGALLTAFYMTRQVSYVFFGNWRGHGHAHESPAVMTAPLAILAFFAVTLGAIGTPAWPWFRAFLEGRATAGIESEPGMMTLMIASSVIVLAGLGLGWLIYGNKAVQAEAPDALERAMPPVWAVLRDKFYVDELYGVTVIAFYEWWAKVADWLDRRVWGGMVAGVALLFHGLARLNSSIDVNWVDGGFDKGCDELSNSGGLLARVQDGRVQKYLRLLALAVVALAAILIWSSRG